MSISLNSLTFLFLFLPIIGFSQSQSFELPQDQLAHRELFLNVESDDVIRISQFKLGEQYSLIINSLQGCEVALQPISTALMEVEGAGDMLTVRPLASELSFAVQNKDCKDAKIDIVLSFFCLSCSLEEESAGRMDGIMTDPNFSPDALIRDVLIGGGCFEVSQVTPIGLGSMGKFTGGESSVGISEGVIITTGPIGVAEGPNNAPNAGFALGGGSDADLAQLAGGTVIDASGVQFSFTPTVEQIAFNYVFASEEYCEFSPSTFNDVFGFFISGPGINGGFSMNGENIATLPGSGVTVSISNVNQSTNAAFFVDNTPANQVQLAGNAALCNSVVAQDGIAPDDCQYDGFTGTLTAIADVIPCETYLIRLLVGDVSDGIYDSAVLLEANSFSAGGQGNVSASIPGVSPEGFGIAYEGCADGFLVFNRIGDDITEQVEITYSIDPSSTAIPGVDFSDLPPSIIIPPGETQVLVPFNVFNDFIPEGLEFITLNLDNPCTCSQSSLTITIDDVLELQAEPEVFDFCQAQPVVLTALPSGGASPYTYEWDIGPTTSTIQVNPFENETYYVTITDNCGNTAVSEHMVNVTGIIGANINGDIEICGEFPEGWIDIELFGNGPWDLIYAFNGQAQPPIENIDFSPYALYITEPGIYQLLLVSSNNCPGNAQGLVEVSVNEIDFIIEATDPSCAGAADGSINLVPIDGTPGYQYDWIGTDQLNQNPTGLSAGTYQVTIMDAEGCLGDGEIILNEPTPILPEVMGVVDVNCYDPTGGAFSVDVSGGTPDYIYNWDGGLPPIPNQSGLSPGIYTGTITDSSGCIANISAEIVADFAEPIAVANPQGMLSCEIDQVLLTGDGSSTDTAISYQWFDSNNTLLGSDINQMVGSIGMYTLVVTNTINGCTSMASAVVETDDLLPLAVIANPEILDCDTPEITLNGNSSTGSGDISYEWIFNGTTVGTDSVLQVDTPGSYMLVVTDLNNGCSAQSPVIVQQDLAEPEVDAGPNQILTCVSTSVTLSGSGSIGSNFSYSWLNEGQIEIGTTPTIDVDQSGEYTLVVTNSTTGCIAQAVVSVTPDANIPPIQVAVDGMITCTELTALLNGAGSATGPNISYTWTDVNNNIVGNDITDSANQGGLYTLTVLNTTNSCETSMTVMVPEDLAAPQVEAGPNATITCDQSFVELTGSSDLLSGASFQWLDENGILLGTDAILNTEQAGIYTFMVTGANGCSAEDQVTVLLNADVPVADAGNNFTLNCQQDQYVIGGPGTTINTDLIYQWIDENDVVISEASTFTVNYPGTFTLIVTNPNSNCASFDEVIVAEEIALPDVEIGSGGTLDCNNFAFVLGGTGTSQGNNFIYSWTNDAGMEVGTELFYEAANPDTYTFTVINNLTGCTSFDQIEIDQNVVDPVAEAGPAGVLSCDVDFVALNAGSSSIGSNFTYVWLNEGGVPVGNELSVDVEQTGIYTFIVTNETNGCTASDQVSVTPDINLPIADAGPEQILNCNSNQVILDASGSSAASGDLALQWFDPSGTLISTETMISANVAGIYTLQVNDLSNGCDASATVNVVADFDDPVVEAGDDLILDCTTDELSLLGTAIGSGSFSYSWTNADGIEIGSNQILNVDLAGTYTFSVIDLQNGCSSEDQVTVNPDMNAPIAAAGPDGLLNCLEGAFTIDASNSSSGSGIDYEWIYQGALVSTDLVFDIDAPGTYVLMITDSNNGCTAQDQVIVTQDIIEPHATIEQIGASSLDCNNQFVLLDGSNSAPIGAITFSWYNETNPSNILSTGFTLEVDQPGNYILFVENTMNGCTDEIEYFVPQNINTPNPEIGMPGILTCVAENLELSVVDLNDLSNVLILWESLGSGGILSDPNLSTILIDQPGTYQVTLTNPESGCVETTEVTVIADEDFPVAIAEVEDELNCITESVDLSGIGSSSGNFSYTWSGPSIITGGNGLTPTVNASGSYQIQVENLDNGCISYADVTVLENTNVPVDLSASITPPPCAGDPGAAEVILVEGGEGPYLYSIGDQNNFSTNPAFESLFPGAYTVFIQDVIGCEYEEVIQIPYTQPVHAILDPEIEITLGEDAQLFTILSFPENDLGSISWTPSATLSCDDCLNPVAAPFETTIYKISVTDENGCPAEDEILVKVKKNYDIFIPNVFSPNSDGQNDLFMIFSSETGVEEIEEFLIADRWGSIVFKDENFEPNDPAHGWNGIKNNQLLNPGVFVYYAVVRFIDGEKVKFKGDVTLIR